jgi:DNA-binding Xre family transcriptional regulator
MKIKIPVRYLPFSLTKKDKKKQKNMLLKSRRNYKKGIYYTRKKINSFHSKKSNHVLNARKMYKLDSIKPSKELAKATGCSLNSLEKIVKKGEGAYFSSGSRPNQTAQSWGIARLASSITSGKSAAIDYAILEKGCDHNKKAFKLAKKSRKKYGYGNSKTKKIII